MEKNCWVVSLFPGDGDVLLPVGSGKELLRQSWDEPRHSNADWELHLVMRGSCRIDVDNRRCQLQDGQAILIAPGKYHRPKALPGSFARFTLPFAVQSLWLKQALLERVPTAQVLEADPVLSGLAQSIIREGESQRAFSEAYTHALITQYMVRLFRILGLEESKTVAPKVSKARDMTTMIDAYFEKYFAVSAGESDLANRLHISRRQLVRILQETYGMNFRQKLIHTRMDYAAWLLRTTDAKVSQISSTVGYNSEAAFFQVFRKYFGMTPKQYRSRNSSTQA